MVLNITVEEMSLKIAVVLSIALHSLHRSKGGIIPTESDAALGDEEHPSLATSYMHFHGPVEGPAYEIRMPNVLHHHQRSNLHDFRDDDGDGGDSQGNEKEEEDEEYAFDYVAHPKYQFSYGVEDHHTGDFHGQKESRDGHSVSGEYSVKEPSGAIRTVSYHADKNGFRATVHTSKEHAYTDDDADVYGGQSRTESRGSRIENPTKETQEDQPFRGYSTSYSIREEY